MTLLCAGDVSFGPVVQGCRGDFDFTLKFEKIILSILPSAIFIALSVPRGIYLARKAKVVDGEIFKLIKLAATGIYSILQLALLVIGCVRPFELSELSTTANGFSFVAAIFLSILSFLEHSRSPRPSILLSAFLSFTVLCDIVQVRSMWLLYRAPHELTYVRLFTAAIAVKAILVLLESLNRRSWLKWDWKAHSPEETSGLYGLGSFLWLGPLFKMGYGKLLDVSDLFPIDSNISVRNLQTSIAQCVGGDAFQDDKHGLAKSLARSLMIPLLLPVVPRVALLGLTLCQPFVIDAVLSFLEDADTQLTTDKGYGLIAATGLVYIGIPITTALYWYLQERCLFMTRAYLVSALYRQTTQAPVSAEDDSAAITLMSTDVERVRQGLLQLHEFWANPIQAAIVCWLIQRQLGAAAFAAPLAVIFVCVICSGILIHLISPKQTAWMQAIQKRVGHTANVIRNMKHLRISGLTKPVEYAIQKLRVDEIKAGGEFRVFLIYTVGISFTPVFLGPVLSFAVTSRNLNATTIFTSLSYLLLLLEPLSSVFQSAPNLLVAFSCLSRIQEFLMKEPKREFRRFIRPDAISEKEQGEKLPSFVEIRNGNFGWEKETSVLNTINISMASGLTMVIGPVACGKSTLCKALLGEIPISSGEVVIRTKFGKIGYCDQTPFLPNQSIKEVITAFSKFDKDRYANVLEATMLSQDLLLFPNKDQTKIGSDGLSLSGGQKKRISLARALYIQSDILVLDDVLGGLDANTEEHVFHRVFGPSGILKERETVVILATNAVKYLPLADHIVALGCDGTAVEQGRFHDLVANRQYVFGLGVRTDTHNTSNPISIALSKVESEIQAVEAAQDSTQSKESSLAESQNSAPSSPNRATGDWAVFKHYGKTIGPFWISTFLAFGVLFGFFANFPTIWLSYWSSNSFNLPTSVYIGIYALFQCLALSTIVGEAVIGFLLIIRNSGLRLHETALKTVISAPLSFFSQTEVGTITNFFSQDMTLLDGELPMALINTSLQTWNAVGGAAVVAASSPYIIITYPFVILILYVVQRFYLRTSRQIRLLDLETKSPLYTHFLDTIKGVATLRAFDWTESLISVNNDLLDTSQRPAYLLSMIQRCLSFVLNMVVAVIAVLVVTLTTQLRLGAGLTGASLVSIMTLGKTLAHLVQMYTLLETSIGAVSRLKTFSEQTAPEDLPGEETHPSAMWPEKGRIQVKNISASYRTGSAESLVESDNLALRDLSFTIEAGQKVAICGRTGSGKSSIVLLLLRLLDPVPTDEGDLIIDDVSLLGVERSTLRQRIIAVPQDATFFPDGTTFKKNVDPFDAIGEEECQQVLEKTGLWTFVSSRGGLEAGLTADTLSQGQKQLFNLARAVLRRRIRSHLLDAEVGDAYLNAPSSVARRDGGVLILDEVNTSTDLDTQRATQEIILQEFEGYTVIMVSHLLDMVMDFDQVMVMDQGKLVEKGSPMELVNRRESRFNQLRTAGS